jgi:hypothetical protein
MIEETTATENAGEEQTLTRCVSPKKKASKKHSFWEWLGGGGQPVNKLWAVLSAIDLPFDLLHVTTDLFAFLTPGDRWPKFFRFAEHLTSLASDKVAIDQYEEMKEQEGELSDAKIGPNQEGVQMEQAVSGADRVPVEPVAGGRNGLPNTYDPNALKFTPSFTPVVPKGQMTTGRLKS